jgi:hypothetical protein
MWKASPPSFLFSVQPPTGLCLSTQAVLQVLLAEGFAVHLH